MDLAKSYTDWLYNNMSQEEISPGLFELTTPFLDRHNDYTQIYIKNLADGGYEINDFGYTIDDLAMSGFSIDTPKRKKHLNQIISKFGLSLDGEVIYTHISEMKDLPEAKHRLLQAMIYINDMFILNVENIKSFFYEDVSNFFDSHDISYFPDFSLSGKSLLTHNFDFALPKTKTKPERIVKLMNHPDNRGALGQIVFSWSDTMHNRSKDSGLIVILNDNNRTSDKIIDGFNSYRDINIKPVLWSEREDELAS